MVVKRVQTKKPKRAKKDKPRKEGKRKLKLPKKPKEIDSDLSNYILLLYGREKIGKTVTGAQFPEAIFFATEPGTKGLEIFEFNHEDGGVKDWEVFRTGVDLLERSKRFKTVVIDTVDRAYDMCLDWVCENLNIEYPGHDDAGKEDFGKSRRAVKQEFLKQIHRIVQSGRGVVFISHSKETEIKPRSGEKYTRIFPTMGNQARAVVEALVDLFFYCEYAKDVNGKVRRIFVCQGDETIWAGTRPTLTKTFPRFLPMHKNKGYKIIKKAFLGKHKGLDPTTLLPAKTSSKTGRDFILKSKAEARREKALGRTKKAVGK